MECLSLSLSSSPASLNPRKPQKATSRRFIFPFFNSLHFKNSIFTPGTRNSASAHSLPTNDVYLTPRRQTLNSFIERISSNLLISSSSMPRFHQVFVNPHLAFLAAGLIFPVSSSAADAPAVPTEEIATKINLESILVSIDDFFNRYPFFVAGVTFIWLVVIPLAEEYFSKYKFTSAFDAYLKLRDDPNCQLIDIRDKRSIAVFNSPNLKIINKSVLQVEFREGDEDGFLRKVREKIQDPANTRLCILDNFDGNSITVAELLVKNGFKEAYAIRGGIRGKKGWQDIQETLLPSSVHIYRKKRTKRSGQVDINGDVNKRNVVPGQASSPSVGANNSNGYVSSLTRPNSQDKRGFRSSSPYTNYPDLKPPSSPTPSKPQNIQQS